MNIERSPHIPSAHGQAVRRWSKVEPDKENLGVVLNGVYMVLEHRRYPPEAGGDRLILGPIWPEKPDKVIMGQWSVKDFVYEASKAPLVPVAPDPMPTPAPPPEAQPAPAEVAFQRHGAVRPGEAQPKKRRRRRKKNAVDLFADAVTEATQAARRDQPTNLPVQDEGPLATMVGGDHYLRFPEAYRPSVIAFHCKLDNFQFNCLKYMMRHADKNGAEDLDKAIHALQQLKALAYPNQ